MYLAIKSYVPNPINFLCYFRPAYHKKIILWKKNFKIYLLVLNLGPPLDILAFLSYVGFLLKTFLMVDSHLDLS